MVQRQHSDYLQMENRTHLSDSESGFLALKGDGSKNTFTTMGLAGEFGADIGESSTAQEALFRRKRTSGGMEHLYVMLEGEGV